MGARLADMKHVALLRAVNLGGKTTLNMSELREVMAKAGHEDVTTYAQSGNVVLDGDDPDSVRASLEGVILDHWGRSVPVLVRTADEWSEVVAANPYPSQAGSDPTKVHAMFLSEQPPAEAWERLDMAEVAPDEMTVGDRVIYLHLPNGIGRAPLPVAIDRLALEAVGTTRNWRTVMKLLDLVTTP